MSRTCCHGAYEQLDLLGMLKDLQKLVLQLVVCKILQEIWEHIDTVRAIVTLFFLSRHVWLAVSYIPICRISPAGGFFKLVWIGLPSPLWCFVLACPWFFFPHRFSAWNCPVIALHPLDFALDFSSFTYLFPSCSFIPHRSPC